LLALEKIGVEITETCILIPEKSVTAITGITS
jgi:cobalamin-dependent methionine synthase I